MMMSEIIADRIRAIDSIAGILWDLTPEQIEIFDRAVIRGHRMGGMILPYPPANGMEIFSNIPSVSTKFERG